MSAPAQYHCFRLSSLSYSYSSSYSYSYSYSAPSRTSIDKDAIFVSIATTRTISPLPIRNGLRVDRFTSPQDIFSWSNILAPFEYEFECRPCGTEYEYDCTAAGWSVYIPP